MNKNEELVIRYLSGEMEEEELLTFELRLNNSDEFKKLADEYSKVFDKVNKQKSVEGNYFYFENILQKFYSQNKSKSKSNLIRNLAYASIIVVFISVSYVFYSNFPTENINNLETITQEVSEDQIMEIVHEYSLVDNSDLSSLSSNSILDQQLNSFYNSSTQSISQKILVEDITDNLSDYEIEQIYSELINKKIL